MEKTIDNDHLQDKGNTEKLNLLIIDDEEELLELLVDELNDTYAVFTASSAERGLNILNEKIISLIISDIVMTGMDGLEFCHIIKTSCEFSHIPFILLTNRNTLSCKIDGLEVGADAYIDKPFSSAFLRAQISSLLKNRIKIQQYFIRSPLAHINTLASTREDERFLERLNNLIITDLHNKDLSVEDLAEAMNMSRASLYRKIKAVSDISPNELINLARLKRAAELLVAGELRMYEISDIVGYGSQSYFSRSFIKQFGILPSEYVLKNSLSIHKRNFNTN